LRLLLDEMYSAIHAEALQAVGIDTLSVIDAGLAGRSDPDVLAAACEQQRVLLTENVGDFARISAEHVVDGHHHPGVLIALSARFSRRPAGLGSLVAAISAVAQEPLEDRVVYLQAPER
jgi:hypothetical protein